MANCRQACPYNTLDGCKVKEYNAICPLTNMATPVTEYRMTNADRIRRTDDVELMNRIYELHVLLSELGHYELAEQFCDCKAECASGEDCNEDRLKACILRWLQKPMEDATNENISNPQSGDAHKN